MSYISENLADGEKVLYQTTVTLWAYAINVAFSIGLAVLGWYIYQEGQPVGYSIALLVPAVFMFSITKMLRDANELAVTNQRVMIKIGWIWQKSTMVYLTRVEGVEVNQTLTGRLLGFGTIQVRGVGTEVFPVKYVLHPKEFRRQVFNAASAQANCGCPEPAGAAQAAG